MNPDVSIHKVTGRQSEVTYRPSLRDQARFSPRGVRAQFIVRYDVARELAAADFQVSLNKNIGGGGGDTPTCPIFGSLVPLF